MRTYSLFRSVSVGFLGLALLAAVSCSDSRRNVEYYYPDDLKAMNLPVWQVTNAIPLTPDQAVLAATHYSSVKHPDISSWDVDSIELQKEFGTTNTWIYSVTLIDQKSGSREYGIKVLMDGSIWKPTTERHH